MKTYVILGYGYIGQYIYNHITSKNGNATVFIERRRIETFVDALRIVMSYGSDTLFINCIGKTGRPNIDWCEDHRKETAWANVTVPFYIARACKAKNRFWIHIGSGCIYDGYEKDWTEEDTPNYYESFYSSTKSFSQELLQQYDNIAILRIRMPIDDEISDRSYIGKLLRYAREGKAFFDLPNSMTYLPDLVTVIEQISQEKMTGTWNVVNPDPLTASEVLKPFFNEVSVTIKPYATIRAGLKTGRSNCVLSGKKLKDHGMVMQPLKKVLAIR